jgi:hypothetical protein
MADASIPAGKVLAYRIIGQQLLDIQALEVAALAHFGSVK